MKRTMVEADVSLTYPVQLSIHNAQISMLYLVISKKTNTIERADIRKEIKSNSHLERNGVPIDYIAQYLRVVVTRKKGLTVDDKRDGDMRDEEEKECCSRGTF